jgi:hypothetical protein
MHELRRRFGINGHEDDVCAIDLGEGRVFVGLPPREGSLLGELLRGGDLGCELSLDPRTPVVVGLYPMRPVARSWRDDRGATRTKAHSRASFGAWAHRRHLDTARV